MTLLINTINGDLFTFENYILAELMPDREYEPIRYMLKIIDKDHNIIFFNMDFVVYFTEKKEDKNDKARPDNIVLLQQET